MNVMNFPPGIAFRNLEDPVREGAYDLRCFFMEPVIPFIQRGLCDVDVGKLGLAGNAHHEGGPEHHVHTFQLPRGAGVRPGFFFVSSVRSIHDDLAGGLDGTFPIL